MEGRCPASIEKKQTHCLTIPSFLPPVALDPEKESHYGISPFSKPKASKWLAVRLTGTSLSEI